jgi:hypothetical protein
MVIRKLAPGKYRLYSRHKNPKTGCRRNLGTFSSKKAALQHEREIQFFKRIRQDRIINELHQKAGELISYPPKTLLIWVLRI